MQGKPLAENLNTDPAPQSHTIATRAYFPLAQLANPLVWDACENGTYPKVPGKPQSEELLEHKEGYLSPYKLKDSKALPASAMLQGKSL